MQIFLYIIFWVIFGILILKLISTFVSLFLGSPSGETSVKLAQHLFEEINLQKGETLYDLGCGYGNIGAAASKFQAKIIGYEISPFPYLICKIRSLFIKNFSVKYINLKKADLSDADIVYCYLLPDFLAVLAPKLLKELPKNTMVISLTFEIKGLKKEKTIIINGKRFHIYKINK